MGGIWNGTWLTVAFLSEVAALVALGAWGWSADGATALRVVLAAGAPLVAAVAWACSPHRRRPCRCWR